MFSIVMFYWVYNSPCLVHPTSKPQSLNLLYFAEELEELFGKCGFVVAQACYVHKETVNHKENISAPRVFVQGKFVKKEEQQTGN